MDGTDLARDGATSRLSTSSCSPSPLSIGVLSVLLVISAVVFAVEVLLVLLAVGLGVLDRFLFGRPWTAEVRVKGTLRTVSGR